VALIPKITVAGQIYLSIFFHNLAFIFTLCFSNMYCRLTWNSHTCVAIYTSMPVSWRKYYNNYHHYY